MGRVLCIFSRRRGLARLVRPKCDKAFLQSITIWLLFIRDLYFIVYYAFFIHMINISPFF